MEETKRQGSNMPKVVMKERTTQENNEAEKKAISSADMTRRMVCGGLAGMVAKVSL